MKRLWKTAVAIAMTASLSVGLGACSSSKKSEVSDIAADDEIPSLDAGTDPVPADGAQAMDDLDDGAVAELEASAEAPAEPSADTPSEPLASEPLSKEDPFADASTHDEVPPPTAGHENGSGQYEHHVFQAGDTLMKLAFDTYGDIYAWRRIYEANRDVISDPNHVMPGTRLKLERPMSSVSIERNGESYLIKQGDTLGTISDDVYGTVRKWRKLWENNRQLIKDPNRIFAGFYLYYTLTPEDQIERDQFKQPRLGSAAPSGGQRSPSSTIESAQALAVPDTSVQ